MHALVPRRSCLILLTFAISCGVSCVRDSEAGDAASSGTIEGTVTYRRDSRRPWRYGRYYIKDAKTGELAEAVVAIRSRKLVDANDPPANTVTIDQQNFQFEPETIAVRAGDSVTFTNSDDAIHNVRSSSRIVDFNVTVAPAGSYTLHCDRAGGVRDPIQVGCVFHSSMQAWVFVFDHPHFQITDTDGRFGLEGIPAGQYDLEMAHPAGGLRWTRKVDVQAGETLHVDIVVSPDDKKN